MGLQVDWNVEVDLPFFFLRLGSPKTAKELKFYFNRN